MLKAIDVAKYFMKRGMGTDTNTFDGNMKLQKLLFFANLIHMAENGTLLFQDDILAFEGGCVIESLRIKYKHDFNGLMKESREYDHSFDENEYKTLNLTLNIFGKLTAKELSDLNHTFAFWKEALEASKSNHAIPEYHTKENAVISVDKMKNELLKINSVLSAYKSMECVNCITETINGVNFHYDPVNIKIDDEILAELEQFSIYADEPSYSIYKENNELVIA